MKKYIELLRVELNAILQQLHKLQQLQQEHNNE